MTAPAGGPDDIEAGERGRPGLRRVAALVPTLLRLALLRFWRPAPRSASPRVSDLSSIEVQRNVRIEVCWLVLPHAEGPSASVYVLGDEVLRLDCLGGAHAHIHGNVRQSAVVAAGRTPRLHLPPGTLEQHVERAVFEVAHNLPGWIALNLRSRVRRVAPDGSALGAAAGEMGRRMIELAARRAVPVNGVPGAAGARD